MRRITFLFVAAAPVLASAPGLASAQQPAPGVLTRPGPTFSPFLNLTRRDIDPAVNYFGIVQPQIATANALRSIQQQITPSLQQQMAGQGAIDSSLPITGQPSFFLNTGGYFLNSRTGSAPLTNARPAPLLPPAAPATLTAPAASNPTARPAVGR